MFDISDKSFSRPDDAEIDSAISAQLPVVSKRDRDEFAVSVIELGTRLTSRDIPHAIGLWRTPYVESARRRENNREILRDAWLGKLASKPPKFFQARYQTAARATNALVLSPDFLIHELERQFREQAPVAVLPASATVQDTLPLEGDFSPSQKLVAFWVRGVLSHRPTHILRVPEEYVQITAPLQADFAKMINSIFATVGQQRRYTRERATNITVGGRFVTEIQDLLCETFQIIQDEAYNFLFLLREEMASSLSSGSQIRGAWGHIRLNLSGDIEYALTDAFFAENGEFRKSEDVE